MLKTLIEKLTGSLQTTVEETDENANRLSFAALLVEAARADEDYTDAEKKLIDRLLVNAFALSSAEAATLRNAAETAQEEAHDLYRFTRTIKDQFTREEQLSLIEDLWEIILSDDVRDPHEDMLIRRLAGLLHFEDREVQEARLRVNDRKS